MTLHTLKTDSEVFEAVLQDKKTFEIRKNDRCFRVGDELCLEETVSTGAEMKAGADLKYTGREIFATVIYILHGPVYGLMEGWVIMSIVRS